LLFNAGCNEVFSPNGFAPNFFQGLGENTSLQPALKSNALSL